MYVLACFGSDKMLGERSEARLGFAKREVLIRQALTVNTDNSSENT